MASGRLWGGGGLLAVAAFMLLGFMTSSASFGTAATIAAFLVSVVLPGVTGGALIRSHFTGGRSLTARQEALRLETIESELIRLAGRHGGRLTIVEAAGELGVPAAEAKSVLDELMAREIADIEVTESGVLVYAFHDVEYLEDKSSARPLLDPGPDRGFDLEEGPRTGSDA
jgi:hypothetical protein